MTFNSDAELNQISRFLYLFQNKNNEYLAYNGLNNSFMKLNKNLYDLLKRAKKNIEAIKILDKETREALEKAKIICQEKDIFNAINQKKVLRQYDTFSSHSLGLTIAPTSACNFTCPYCFEKGITQKTMTPEVISDLISFIERRSSRTNNRIAITWYGGEPLLAIDIILSIYKKIKEKGIEITYTGMITNGFFLNNENIEKLQQIKLQALQITFDGSNPKTHNRRRFTKDGEGSWDRILQNIDLLLSKKTDLNQILIRCNIDEKNKSEYDALESNLLKRWKNDKRVYIHPAILQEYNKDTNTECHFINDQEASEFLINAAKRKKNIPYFKYSLGGCSATRINSYLVGPEGELYKCWNDLGRSNKIVGNIKNDEIQNRDLLFNYLGSPTMFDEEECLHCPLFIVCDGGCQEKRIENKINSKTHNLCHYANGYLDEYLSAYYEIKTQKNTSSNQQK